MHNYSQDRDYVIINKYNKSFSGLFNVISQGRIAGSIFIFFSISWAIIYFGLPASLAVARPSLALFFNENAPLAITSYIEPLVQNHFNAASTKIPPKKPEITDLKKKIVLPNPPANNFAEKLDTLADKLKLTLIDEPINPYAFRLLGQIELINKNEKSAEKYMKGAINLSLHESLALYWLMNVYISSKKYDTALEYAVVLLITQPQITSIICSRILEMSENDNARKLLIQKLSSYPEVRKRFFQSIRNATISNPSMPLKLFLDMQSNNQTLDTDDIQGYIDYLVSMEHYAAAYGIWLRFLPDNHRRGLSYVTNGSFDAAFSGHPFDWFIGKGIAVTTSIRTLPKQTSNHALLINFANARITFPDIRQMIVLEPGKYKLSGYYTGTMEARRGLVWIVSCVSGRMITKTDMLHGSFADWRHFSIEFSVPQEKCEAQYLSLNHDIRSPSEQFASGYLWFDNIRIEEAEDLLSYTSERAQLLK